MKTSLKIANLAIVFISMAMPLSTFAAGIQISPARLDFEASSNPKQLLIVNPTPDVQIYEVFADDFTDIIRITPESFTLEAGGSKTVNVALRLNSLRESQNLSTTISVVSKPLAENKLNLATGAKIPVSITYQAPKDAGVKSTNLAILTGAVVIALGGYWLGKRKK